VGYCSQLEPPSLRLKHWPSAQELSDLPEDISHTVEELADRLCSLLFGRRTTVTPATSTVSTGGSGLMSGGKIEPFTGVH
jgi:hypothetical protein